MCLFAYLFHSYVSSWSPWCCRAGLGWAGCWRCPQSERKGPKTHSGNPFATYMNVGKIEFGIEMLCRKFSLLFLRVIVWGAEGLGHSGTVDKSREGTVVHMLASTFGSFSRVEVSRIWTKCQVKRDYGCGSSGIYKLKRWSTRKLGMNNGLK